MSSLPPPAPTRHELLVPTGLALLGLLAVYIGRGLSQALPGTASGMDRVVSIALFAGSFVTQLFAILGATVGLRWALWLGGQPRLPPALRASVVLVSLGVCVVVFFAAQPRQYALGPLILAALAMAASGLLTAAAVRAVLHRSTRAVGLVVGTCAVAALLHLASRGLAHSASGVADAERFELARVVATAAFAFGVSAAVLAALLLWRNTGVGTRASAVVLLVCVPALFIGDTTHGFRLAIIRALERLTAHPDPLVPSEAHLATHLAVMVLVMTALASRSRHQLGAASIAFALLGRSSADTPVGALLLSLAGLTLLMLETGEENLPLNQPIEEGV